MNRIFLISGCKTGSGNELLASLQSLLISKFIESRKIKKVFHTFDESTLSEYICHSLRLQNSCISADTVENQAKFIEAFYGLDENVAILASKDSIRSLLKNYIEREAAKAGYIVQFDAGVNIFKKDENGIALESYGEDIHIPLSVSLCDEMLTIADTPQAKIERGKKLTELCLKIAEKPTQKGALIDSVELSAASRLCDITEGTGHAEKNADIIDAIGFRETAEMIRFHHEIPENKLYTISGAHVLYLADRLLQQDGSIISVSDYIRKIRADTQLTTGDADITQFTADLLNYED